MSSYPLTSEKLNILHNMFVQSKMKNEKIYEAFKQFFVAYHISAKGEKNKEFSYGEEHTTNAIENVIKDSIQNKFINFPIKELGEIKRFSPPDYYSVDNVVSRLGKKEGKIVVKFLMEQYPDFINYQQKTLLEVFNIPVQYRSYHENPRFVKNSITFYEAILNGKEITSPESFDLLSQTMDIVLKTDHDKEIQAITLNILEKTIEQNVEREIVLNWFVKFIESNSTIYTENKETYDNVIKNFTKEELTERIKKDDLARIFADDSPLITRKVEALSFIGNVNKYKIQNKIPMPTITHNFKVLAEIMDFFNADIEGYLSSSFYTVKQECIFNIIHETENKNLKPFIEYIINTTGALNEKQRNSELLTILNKHKETYLLAQKLEKSMTQPENKPRKNKI